MRKFISYLRLEIRYFINWFSGVLPFSIQYVLFVPILYTVKTLGAVQFESARFVNVVFQYLKYNKIVGDYAEFGVFKGGTTIEAVRASNRADLPTKFFLFDHSKVCQKSPGLI